MNLIELDRALRQLRLGGMAAVLETRLQQAQAEPMAPIDFLSCLVSNSRAAASGCWNDGGSKRSFAIRRRPWTTSISTSTRR